MTAVAGAWPEDWIVGEPIPPPQAWGRPGLLMVFSVECAGCVSRAIPWLRGVAERRGDDLVLAAVHTSRDRVAWPREQVAEAVLRLVRFARLQVSVALDTTGAWAEAQGAEGTPHWFAYDADGRRIRSIFGSQANALTRLEYLVEELVGA